MCLGMHLARLETRVMLNSLLDRVENLTLEPDDETRIVGVTFRSPNSLPVTFSPGVVKSRAAILHDVGGPWSVEEFELDPPKAGEVLVKMAAAGLCHSDDHILKGDMSAPNEVMRSMGLPTMFPTIGGHEGSGIVQEVGEGVTEFAPGDHVVMSFVAVCGQCRWCATGAEYICDAGIGTMIPGMPTDGTFRHHTADGRDLGHLAKVGTFAEHTVASTKSLVKIEQHLPLAPSALLSCAIPTGYGSVANRSNMRAGDTVVVIGVGGIGTAAIQSARINGAAQIIAVDPVEFKQKSALQFGATHSAATAGRGDGSGAGSDVRRDGRRGRGVTVADEPRRRPRWGGTDPQGRNLRAHRDDVAADPVGQDQPAGIHPDEQDVGGHHLRLVQSEGGHRPAGQALPDRPIACSTR